MTMGTAWQRVPRGGKRKYFLIAGKNLSKARRAQACDTAIANLDFAKRLRECGRIARAQRRGSGIDRRRHEGCRNEPGQKPQ